jgi:hypothetical protein
MFDETNNQTESENPKNRKRKKIGIVHPDTIIFQVRLLTIITNIHEVKESFKVDDQYHKTVLRIYCIFLYSLTIISISLLDSCKTAYILYIYLLYVKRIKFFLESKQELTFIT